VGIPKQSAACLLTKGWNILLPLAQAGLLNQMGMLPALLAKALEVAIATAMAAPAAEAAVRITTVALVAAMEVMVEKEELIPGKLLAVPGKEPAQGNSGQ